MTTKGVSVKVLYLRNPKYNDGRIYNNLKEWLADDNNVYVGRHGRVFMVENGEKKVFNYSASCFKNPFKIKEHGMNCLVLYEQYLMQLLQNNHYMDELKKLKGKNLGCFCPPNQSCHRDILIREINRRC